MDFMLSVSLYEGSLDTASSSRGTSRTSPTRSATTSTQFLRSFVYAGIATLLCLVIAYPLAYAIAFQGRALEDAAAASRSIAPFFTTYLIRTYAWQTILSNDGSVVDFLKTIGLVADNGTILKTPRPSSPASPTTSSRS